MSNSESNVHNPGERQTSSVENLTHSNDSFDSEPKNGQEAPVQPISEEGDGVCQSAANELVKAKARIKELEGDFLRARADIENVNRRATKQVGDAHRYAVERFALEVILIRDHLELGLDSLNNLDKLGKEAAEVGDGIKKGFTLIAKSFPDVLNRFEIKEIDCLNQNFDPKLHEAVGQERRKDVEPNTVVIVRQKGYTIGERLLRPALVVVSQHSSS